jgi:secondary thiamine-phosphate synthase enzyme
MDLLDVLAPVPISCHALIRFDTTRSTEFIDLTDRLQQLVARTRVHCGILNVQTLHTTTAVVVNEMEPLLLDDFSTLLEGAAPRDASYRHDDLRCRTVNLTPDERVNGHAHCQALLLASAVSLNVVDGRIRLGRWQRVLMAELDGPRTREISVVVVGEKRS